VFLLWGESAARPVPGVEKMRRRRIRRPTSDNLDDNVQNSLSDEAYILLAGEAMRHYPKLEAPFTTAGRP
jgi:hypothetical protein